MTALRYAETAPPVHPAAPMDDEEKRPESNYPEIPVNEEAIAKITQEADKLQDKGNFAAFLYILALSLGSSPLGLFILSPIAAFFFTAKRLAKLGAIELLATRILEEFRQEEVEVRCAVPVPDRGTIDLLVRFPNPPKQGYLIQLRTMGSRRLRYKEDREGFYWYGGKYSQRKRSPVDYFELIGEQELWLKKPI